MPQRLLAMWNAPQPPLQQQQIELGFFFYDSKPRAREEIGK
eukprot:SAG11_NODE_22211_length_410_cov_0.810289_1_plen_40_part_01